ncbi:S-phase kinase-associated protein 2 [Microtus ochrogaster]|uniref:S-phase kinase-associated protein 2 n=1 Tax=Microtus ochrogaster TaxID=79684 RepID=A0A8J6H0Z3_MICOH|nr:S-phase kinase-associated protein 2 [Microtus ochrogaster]
MGVSALEKEEVDSENIPHELLSNLGHPQSPPRKRLKSKGSEKDFVIIRRPKLNRENFPGVSWDSLPDELLLGIFSCLCLPELLRVSGVCKRWYRLSLDESLWQSLDLAGKNLHPDVTVRLLSRGVIAFRCPRSFMEQPLGESFSSFRVQHMDLSNSVINVSNLHGILSECSKLQNLSLEGLQLSDPIVNDSIMLKNDCFPEFFQLNYLQHLSLSRCYDIIPETLLELGEIPTLKTLQVFGIVPDATLQLLREALPHLQINCAYFTTIARPTMDNKKNPEIWGIKCRLTLQKPGCV